MSYANLPASGSPANVPTAVGIEGPEPLSPHPVARFFHVCFKVSAIILYLFANWFSISFVLLFVVCVLLLAFDFWTVKNVTGRLLVGLRWWNEVLDDGSNVWVFESQPQNRQIHAGDSSFFWISTYVTPIVWLLLALTAIIGLKLDYLLIVCVALVLSCANVVGYWKCQRDAGKRVQSYIASKVLSVAVQNMGSANV